MDYKAIIDGVENVSRFGKLFKKSLSQTLLWMRRNFYNITKIDRPKRRKKPSLTLDGFTLDGFTHFSLKNSLS